MNQRTKPGRIAIHVEGFAHGNPIPAACRIGNIVMSGVINGVDPATGDFPETLDEQCAFLFEQVDRIVTAAGGSMDDIIKFTVWMKDSGAREALNRVWLIRFPDEATRPARHTMQAAMAGKRLVQCDFAAVIEPPDSAG